MKRRPIDPSIQSRANAESRGPTAPADDFREALSHWASGVALVAVRDGDDGRVYGTTASSFGSVSADPPRVMMSLGAGAQVLPFLARGQRFGVSILGSDQRHVASMYADAYPVGPSPFPENDDPLVRDAHATLVCTVGEIFPVGSSRIVTGEVLEASPGEAAEPLLYHGRDYRTLG